MAEKNKGAKKNFGKRKTGKHSKRKQKKKQ